MMAPIRVAGTRNAMASAFTDIPSGLRNSSLRISPGCVATRLGVDTRLMVVDDFGIGRTLRGPYKADAPLIVDTNRVLPLDTVRVRLLLWPHQDCTKPSERYYSSAR